MNANNEKTTKAKSQHGAPLASKGRRDTAETDSVAELSITIKNGVATLSGSTATHKESNLAESLVTRMDGVEQVINLISSNNAYSL